MEETQYIPKFIEPYWHGGERQHNGRKGWMRRSTYRNLSNFIGMEIKGSIMGRKGWRRRSAYRNLSNFIGMEVRASIMWRKGWRRDSTYRNLSNFIGMEARDSIMGRKWWKDCHIRQYSEIIRVPQQSYREPGKSPRNSNIETKDSIMRRKGWMRRNRYRNLSNFIIIEVKDSIMGRKGWIGRNAYRNLSNSLAWRWKTA